MRALLMLSMLFVASAHSQPRTPSPTKSSQPSEQRIGSKEAKAADNQAVPAVPPSVSSALKTETSTDNRQGESSTDWWTRILTFFIAAATVAQAYIYWREKALMASGLSETAKSASAAKASADALLNIERSWLLMDLIGNYPTIPIQVSFRFHNHGRTPAWITEFRCQFTKSPTEVLGPINYLVLRGKQSPYQDIIPPGGQTKIIFATLDGTGLLEEAEQLAVINGSMHIHLFGIIKYRDIFMARETRFCFSYVPKGKISVGDFLLSGPPEANQCT